MTGHEIGHSASFTPGLLGFHKEMQRISGLMAYTVNLEVLLSDEDRRRQAGLELDEDDLQFLTPEQHTPFVRERMLCALVETLLWYVASLLRTVFSLYPHQMLSASKSADTEGIRVGASESTVPLRAVLEYETREQLLVSIVDDKVDRLSYRSLASLNDYFKEALRLPLTDDKTLLESTNRAVAMRNVLVHNRGLANRRFRSLWGNDAPPLGQRVEVSDAFLTEAFESVESLVKDVEARAVRKYLRSLDLDGLRRLMGLMPDADSQDEKED